MVTVIYVHGTGVRNDEYQEAFRLIGKKFYSFPGVKVAPCLWGNTYGARLNASGLSIPTYDTARAIEEYEDDDNYTALWELLYSDPLCELRAINVDKKEKVPFHPVEMSPGEKFEYEIRNHKYSSTFLRKLQDVGLDNVFYDALKSVINSEPFKTAVNFNPGALIDDYSIIARAITAKALKICEERQRHPQILYDAVMRDDFVEILTSEFGGTARSIFGALAKPFIYLAKTKFTNHAKRKRGAIMDKAYMFPGDVLLYQARGDDIRKFIRSCITKENFPVVLIAHSLGGIACVELLVQYHLHQVKLLVTIGS